MLEVAVSRFGERIISFRQVSYFVNEINKSHLTKTNQASSKTHNSLTLNLKSLVKLAKITVNFTLNANQQSLLEHLSE